MDVPARKKQHSQRSRSGCLECRQHHQKCDELRPVCSRCQGRGLSCTYKLRITWGGRSFRKSPFGQYMVSTGQQPAPVLPVWSAHTEQQGVYLPCNLPIGTRYTNPGHRSLTELLVVCLRRFCYGLGGSKHRNLSQWPLVIRSDRIKEWAGLHDDDIACLGILRNWR